MYSCQVLDKNVTKINFCCRLSTFCQLMLCNKSSSRYPASMQRFGDVPWRSPKSPNVRDNTKIDDLMKKAFLDTIILVYTSYCFYRKNKFSKVLNRTSRGRLGDPVAGGPGDQMMGRSGDIHSSSVIRVFLSWKAILP